MRTLLWMMVLLMNVTAFGYDSRPLPRTQVAREGYLTRDCRVSGFTEKMWDALVAKERRLQEHLDLIATETGQPGPGVKLQNCHVRFPVYLSASGNEWALRNGDWVVILHHSWQSRGPEGQLRSHQAGMKAVFTAALNERVDPCTCQLRSEPRLELRGVSRCWGPDGCEAMGLPFEAEQLRKASEEQILRPVEETRDLKSLPAAPKRSTPPLVPISYPFKLGEEARACGLDCNAGWEPVTTR